MKPYYDHVQVVIYHGDWREIPEINNGDKYSLLLTDPPYGINEAAGRNKTRGGKFGGSSGSGKWVPAKDYGNDAWDSEPIGDSDISLLRCLAHRQIIFGGNYFNLPPSKCWLVWDKINSGDFADCELAWTNLDKAVRQFRYMWNGMLREGDDVRMHPTQKPLALMKWCIQQANGDNWLQTVCDPYMGSGTTLVAAKALGLAAVGIEREERYCESAAIRLSQEVLEFQ